MSTIFKARDLQNGNALVVVKVPLPMFSSGLGAWSMFQREEVIGRQLEHPYILKFLPLAIDKHRSYLVTEYVPGVTLADRLKRDGVLQETEALAIASQVCEAIDYLHQRQFVHYDLKPANVILCPDGTIRLIDFGLAHAAVTARFSWSAPAPAIGSSSYVAPEQIQRRRGRKSVDIYGVGAMLYEMLTGQAPFPGDDPFIVASARLIGDPPAPRSLNPHLSNATEEITLRALRRDPADRYASVAAMKEDLDRPERVVVSGICDHLQPVTRWGRSLRVARFVAITSLMPIAVLLALFRLLWWYLDGNT